MFVESNRIVVHAFVHEGDLGIEPCKSSLRFHSIWYPCYRGPFVGFFFLTEFTVMIACQICLIDKYGM